MVLGLEALYLAGELRLEKAGVEVGDGAGAADACFGVFPSGGNVVAEGSDGAQAGDYDSFKFH